MSNEQIAWHVSLAGRLLNARITAELSEHGFGRGEYRILFALYREEGVSQSQLSEQYHLDKSVVARVVDRLEKKGFIERQSDPADERRNLLYLTPKADDIRPDIAEVRKTIKDEIARGLSDEEKVCLLKGLRTVCDNLDAAQEPESTEEVS